MSFFRRASSLSGFVAQLVVAAGLALSLSALVGCGENKGDKEVVIGHFGSMTGDSATFGTSTENGIKMAIDELNAKGGFKGEKVRLITYDTAGKSQDAGTAVTRLITQDKVTAVLGEVASSLSIAGGRVAQQFGTPMISPASTNATVTEIGDRVFRVCFIDSFQGYVVAKFAVDDLKLKNVATLYDQKTAYSKGLKEDFKKALEAAGGKVAIEVEFTGGDPDFSAQLNAIRAAKVDAIFIPAYYNDVANIAIQARKMGMEQPLLGTDGWDSAKLVEIGGASIEGGYYSNHYSPEDTSPAVQNFLKSYAERYKSEADAMAALGYDAARILFDAMGRAKSLENADLAAAIASTKDFSGVTGLITIDAQRNAKKAAVMLQIKGGRATFVKRVEPLP